MTHRPNDVHPELSADGIGVRRLEPIEEADPFDLEQTLDFVLENREKINQLIRLLEQVNATP